MKNILIVVPGLSLGGQERVAIKTAEILSRDYNVYFCVFNLSGAVYKTHFDVINLNVPSKTGLTGKVINVIKRKRALKRIVRKLSIDVTLSFGTTANLVNVLSKKSNKVIVSVRGYESLKNKFSFGKLVYSKANKVICVAEKLSKDLSVNYKVPVEKVETLYNPYEFTDIKQQSLEQISLKTNNPSIVSMGRLEHVKGYRHLLNSIKIAIEKIPNLQLILIGEGKERESLERHATKLGIKDNIIFTGFQSNPYRYLSKADLYVLSSINEGFPNALVEAMICGLPVIATDCKTGPREILTEKYEDRVSNEIEHCEYGVLVPPFISDFSYEPDKEKLLSNAIVEMLTNNKLYNYYRKQSNYRSKAFSVESYRKKIIDIIEK